MTKRRMQLLEDNRRYESDDGHVLAREYAGETPNGNKLNGVWVLRDPAGAFLDHSMYRIDIAERHGFELSDGV
jgi:hypothetical protein